MELWAPVRPLYDEGRYAEAADATKALLAGEGGNFPAILYNLACCESLAGRTDDAIEHLRASLNGPGTEQTRRLAAEDSDLDPLRDEPAFKELLG